MNENINSPAFPPHPGSQYSGLTKKEYILIKLTAASLSHGYDAEGAVKNAKKATEFLLKEL